MEIKSKSINCGEEVFLASHNGVGASKHIEVGVFVEICREGAVLPEYKNKWDAGMDVYAACDVVINRGETAIVPTGLKMAIPEGYEIQVRPRSGISFNTPVRISNSPGTIDSGYRDELGIIVTNTSNVLNTSNTSNTSNASNASNVINTSNTSNASNASNCDGAEYLLSEKGNKQGTYRIKAGDRIAQIVLAKVPRMKFVVVDSVADIGKNRGGGIGSTGV